MKIDIRNHAVSVSNSPDYAPRCLDVNTHLVGREVEVGARYWPARDKSHESGESVEYITVKVHADEHEHEASKDDSYKHRITEQYLYLDMEDVRALRDALTLAMSESPGFISAAKTRD